MYSNTFYTSMLDAVYLNIVVAFEEALTGHCISRAVEFVGDPKNKTD